MTRRDSFTLARAFALAALASLLAATVVAVWFDYPAKVPAAWLVVAFAFLGLAVGEQRRVRAARREHGERRRRLMRAALDEHYGVVSERVEVLKWWAFDDGLWERVIAEDVA